MRHLCMQKEEDTVAIGGISQYIGRQPDCHKGPVRQIRYSRHL